jgi:hypothetical protein
MFQMIVKGKKMFSLQQHFLVKVSSDEQLNISIWIHEINHDARKLHIYGQVHWTFFALAINPKPINQ